jgi:ABC-2 type transport system ATP-binding protein
MPTPIFEIMHLTKTYPGQPPVQANRDISLTIAAGTIWGLFGPNGAGKTTLIRQMLGLLKPTGGCVRLAGEDVTRRPDRVARDVGYLPQMSQALYDFTAAESLYFTGRLRGLNRRAAQAEAARLLEQWQLGPLRNQVVRRMSGGQQRLVGLVSVLMGGPQVLVLDEPTNFMDPALRHQVWGHLLALNHAQGVTILLVTHNVLEAETVVSEVAIVADGRVLAQGAPAELKASLGAQVRLDLTWRTAMPDAAGWLRLAAADAIGESALARRLDPYRWRITADRAAAGEIVRRLMTHASLQELVDLRLHGASLEDFYLTVTGNAQGEGSRAP